MALVPYNYCNPYNIENNYKTFVINGEYIKINQSKDKGIGFTLWDCVKISKKKYSIFKKYFF
jgi:hypothetical protein